MRRSIAFALILVVTASARAETLDLEQATRRALTGDPRVTEQEHLVEAARALIRQATGSGDLMVDVNLFAGIAPTYDGGAFTNGTNTCSALPCTLRGDANHPDGYSPWLNLQFKLIKPLLTFGKIEGYEEAARGNVEVQRGEVRLRRAQVRFDVARAYYGFLAARDSRYLLEDVHKRVSQALLLVEDQIGEGRAKQSDRFALQTGAALIDRYLAQARGLEGVALDGLRVLTGIGLGNALTVADERIEPLPLPTETLADLTERALRDRPEMQQLEAGLRARRALVDAKRAESRPNIYAGIVGSAALAPERERIDNPYLFDPFNHAGATPIVGIQWAFQEGSQSAKVAEAQAQLDALVSKSLLARNGIPFQVAEAHRLTQSQHEVVRAMRDASRAGRRWMITSFADYEAGLEETGRLVEAFKGYVLAHADYLLAVNDYNLQVVKLRQATGAE